MTNCAGDKATHSGMGKQSNKRPHDQINQNVIFFFFFFISSLRRQHVLCRKSAFDNLFLSPKSSDRPSTECSPPVDLHACTRPNSFSNLKFGQFFVMSTFWRFWRRQKLIKCDAFKVPKWIPPNSRGRPFEMNFNSQTLDVLIASFGANAVIRPGGHVVTLWRNGKRKKRRKKRGKKKYFANSRL